MTLDVILDAMLSLLTSSVNSGKGFNNKYCNFDNRGLISHNVTKFFF